MKLHIIATLGLALASGAVLAQTGALPSTPTTDPSKETNGGATKAPIDVSPTDDDGTLGGSITGGTENVSGAVNGTLDPNAQSGKVGAKGSLLEADFGKLDLNANGKLSRDEVRSDTKLLSQFNRMDRNSDGTVDENEFSLSLRANSGNNASGDTDRTPDGQKGRSSSERSRSSEAGDRSRSDEGSNGRNQSGDDTLPGG